RGRTSASSGEPRCERRSPRRRSRPTRSSACWARRSSRTIRSSSARSSWATWAPAPGRRNAGLWRRSRRPSIGSRQPASRRPDVQALGRKLVREHLRGFEVPELIVFCAESPDAATADLGIELYEQERGAQGWELRALVPMFRILLYKVATARREKERLYATL